MPPDERSPSFVEYARALDFGDLVPVLVVAALVLLAIVGFIVIPPLGGDPRVAAAIVLSVAGVLLIAILGILGFETLAAWYRSDPPGSGADRGIRTYDTYRAWAGRGFIALYAFVIVVAIASGWAVGRVVARNGRRVAVATGIATVVYLAVTLPFVEYTNTCKTGEAFVIEQPNACR